MGLTVMEGRKKARRVRVDSYRGPLGSVIACPHCLFAVKIPRGRGMGRGYGLASNSQARSKVIAHIKAEHADLDIFEE